MPKAAIIVESPAKIRTIQRYVGPGFTIHASLGHVRDLPQTGLGVDVEQGFAPQYEIIPRARKVIAQLKKALKDADEVYLATDPDREGEAIAWHLAQALGLRSPRRMRFNEITAGAVREALAQAGEINPQLVDAQQARRVLDRLVGYLISPVLWRRIKGKGRGSLSAGRVQSVALRLVCDREREIAAFQAQEYWTVGATLTPEERETPFTARLVTRDGEKLELVSEEQALPVVEELRRQSYRVAGVEKKRRSRNPYPPFITSTLQQEAARRLRFSTRKTMLVAQQLYEGVELPEGTVALITYMRTDSTRVAQVAQDEARAFISGTYGQDYVGPGVRGKKVKAAQEAHEAIRPTEVIRSPERVAAHLTPDQAALYEVIWKRFVASQMAPAALDVTTVEVAAGPYGLRATGSVVVFPGFLTLYEEQREEDNGNAAEGEEGLLPPLSADEALRLIELSPEQHFTKPPPRYSEASLVRALEEHGIGRPSTYSPIIETLRQRKYVYMEKRRFIPTPLGFVVCDFLVEHFPRVMDVEFTARVEQDLDTIEQGERRSADLLAEFYGPLLEWINQAQEAGPKVLDEKCPECGQPLLERVSLRGKFAGCSGYPECTYVRDLADVPAAAAPAPEPVDEACPECGSQLVRRVARGRPFLGCSAYPKCSYTRSVDEEGEPLSTPKAIPTEIPCEQCGRPLVARHGRRGAFLGCSGFPKCRFTRNLTEAEAQELGVEVSTSSPAAAEETDVTCDRCGRPMLIRSGRRGRFLGCSGYPQCRNIQSLPGGEDRPAPRPLEEQCPECGKQLVVRSGRRGAFVGCSGYPKCRYVRDLSPEEAATGSG